MHSNTPPPAAPGEDAKTATKHVQLPLWRATPLLLMSTGLHVFCALLTVLHPALWQWTLGAVIANHLLILTTVVMWPSSRLLGPNMTRLPAAAALRGEVALTFDDGPDPLITPRVLELLDQYGAKSSFFCIGNKVIAHPELAREIIRRGHSVENHTNSHPHAFAFFGADALQHEIDSAQTAIRATTGVAPVFFRAPMGFRNPFLAPMVERAGLRYTNWTRRGYDTVAKSAELVLQRLQRGLAAGDILLLHDGRSIQPYNESPVILEVLPRLLEHLQALNLKSVSLQTACNPVSRR
jgi:peptidoglycan/xylan/chitin deacetylase (PgdA/CDA1 family)